MTTGRQLKRLLAELVPDRAWAADLAELRALLLVDERAGAPEAQPGATDGTRTS